MVLLETVLLAVPNLSRKRPWLGRLPGDMYVERDNRTFCFPLTGCIVISFILTLIFSLAGRR